MKDSPYTPEFTLYPDPDAGERFTSRGQYLSEQMSIYGVHPVLDGARIRMKDEPVMQWYGAVRSLFEEGYGNANRYGEAFEDGAIAGTLMASKALGPRLMPSLEHKVGSLVEACEREYYGQPGAGGPLFSESRKGLIGALRYEGTKGYMDFKAHVSPVSAQITIAKYGIDEEYSHVVGQGIGFVLNQLKWVHGEDFTKFAGEYESTQKTFVGREGLKEELARQAVRFLELQPRTQT